MLERQGGRQAADPGPMIATGPSRLTVITFPAQAPPAPHPAGQLLLSGACAGAGQVPHGLGGIRAGTSARPGGTAARSLWLSRLASSPRTARCPADRLPAAR